MIALKLVFKNSQGIKHEIADVQNEEEALKEIQKFCADRNYEIYYIRSALHYDVIKYDVGSWSEFFYLYLGEE